VKRASPALTRDKTNMAMKTVKILKMMKAFFTVY
jgi:hypothetical protein